MKTLNNLFQIIKHAVKEYRKSCSQWQRLEWVKDYNFVCDFMGSDYRTSLASYFRMNLIVDGLLTTRRKEGGSHEHYL